MKKPKVRIMTVEFLDRSKISPGTIPYPPHRFWMQENHNITSIISQFSRMYCPEQGCAKPVMYVEMRNRSLTVGNCVFSPKYLFNIQFSYLFYPVPEANNSLISHAYFVDRT